MISRTKLKERVTRKTSSLVLETLRAALKNRAWHAVAQKLSSSTRNYQSVNLQELDAQTKEGDTIVIVGKILASGQLNKKIRISALGISAGAVEKLKKTKSEYVSIAQEIKQNPKAQGIKVL